MTLPTEGQSGHLQKHADIDTLIAGHTSQIAAGDVTNPASAAGIVLSATFATPASAATQVASVGYRSNLDTNPSFESGTAGWTANGAGNTVASSSAQVYSRSQSMLTTWGATYGNAAKSFTATLGLTYTWSAWVYTPIGSAPVALTAYGAMAAQVFSAASSAVGVWQQLSVTFTATGTGITLAIQGVSQPAVGATCYIDASLIEQTAAVRTFFSGASVASGDVTFAWTGTPDASTSTQAVASVPWAAPGSIPTAMRAARASGAYDQRLNLFNWKQSNTRKLRIALGRAKAGTGAAKIGFAGDSTSAGYTALAATQSPPVVIRDMLEKAGYPVMGTGPVVGNPGGGPGGFLDLRWAFTGAWTTQAGNNNFLYQTVVSGATATFTSDKPGTIVELRYMNNGGAFTYSIDGGGAITVTPTGAGTLSSAVVTGLANTTHTIKVTTTTTTAFYLLWADVRGATSGVLIANFGVCSSNTANWIDGTFYFPGSLLGEWSPDCTFLDLGINDVGASIATATIKANLQTLITKFQATGDVILVTSNPHQSLDFTAINQAKYELAVSNDIPLIDICDRFTSYAVSNPLGYYNDAAHPTAAGYADKGATLFKAIA